MQVLVNLRNNFGLILKKRGLTIEEFADMCELTKQGMHNIFNNNDTKISTLLKMCEVADIPIETLFKKEDSNLIAEPMAGYETTKDKYLQCLENNNHLTTQLRKYEEELGALKKQNNSTPIKAK